MSRELKVKAWLKDAKCFAEVRHISFFEGNTVIKIYDQPMSEEIWFDLEELELVQYTGLKDKNGVEIYEGDILNFVLQETIGGYFTEKQHLEPVEYSEGAFWVGDFLLCDVAVEDEEIRIAGNVFEEVTE